MRVLLLQHAAPEGPGTLGTFLEARGVSLTTCRIHEGEPIPPEPGDASAIITLGGPESVVGGKIPRFFSEEAALLSEALRREVPILGICLGAQILARVCGAKVNRAPTVEFGWFPVELTAEGLRDPLFRGAEKSFDVFQWHEDTFDIPRGGTRIAEGALCRNQAFRWGGNAYGLQFHLEVTPEMAGEWLATADRPRSTPCLCPPSTARTARLVYLNFLGNILRYRPSAHLFTKGAGP